MGAYLKVCEGGAYSKKQYFVFFREVFREYTGNSGLYKHIYSYLIVRYMPHNKIYLCV